MSSTMLAQEEHRLEALDRDLEEAEAALLQLEREMRSCRQQSIVGSDGDGQGFSIFQDASCYPRAIPTIPAEGPGQCPGERNTRHLARASSFKVRIRLQSRDERLGLTLQQEGSSVVVVEVRANSAFGRWNASHRDRQNAQVVQTGDVVASLNGARVTSPQDVWKAVIPEVQLHFVFEQRPDTADFEFGSPSDFDARSSSIDQEPLLTLPGDMLPGRCSRAQPGVLPKQGTMQGTKKAGPVQAHRSTFGYGERFKTAVKSDAENERDIVDETVKAAPSDRFLSTKPRCPSAVMAPLPERAASLEDETHRWLMNVCSSMGVSFTNGKSLRGLHSSMVALLQEEMLREELRQKDPDFLADQDEEDNDDFSTEFGSDFEQEASVASSFLSMFSSRSKATPGPGSYNVDYSLTESRRAGPRFGSSSRHLASPDRKRETEEWGADPEEDYDGRSRSRSRDRLVTRKGGKINPPHRHQPRLPTERMKDETAAATRALSVAEWGGVGESAPGVDFSGAPKVGRLDPVKETDEPGPGSYNTQHFSIPGLGAVIQPQPVPVPTTAETGPDSKAASAPGPGFYEVAAANSLVYRSNNTAADFSRNTPHFARDQVPAYVAGQEHLSPQWDSVLQRSLNCIIPPEPRRRTRRGGQVPGPGAYFRSDNFLDDGHTVVRLRDGRMVVRWLPLHSGRTEHDHGLYQERPVDPSIRGDPRPLLGGDTFDATVRHRHRVALFLPEGKITQRRRRSRSWDAADGINYPFPEGKDPTWRLADPQLAPEPEGVGSFARRIAFEDFASNDARWARLEKRAQKRDHPSRRLTYSLPSLDLTKEQAHRAPDFSRQRARSLGGDDSEPDLDRSPREGDVLRLSLSREQDLMHQRAPMLVDMDRMRGRAESSPPDFGGDDEELLLSPRHVLRRSRSPVQMNHMLGRPEDPELSANLWAEQNGVLYTYHRAPGFLGDEGESLLLDTSGTRRRRPQGGDFFRRLGRPGIDPRLPAGPSALDPNGDIAEDDEIEELFLDAIRANDLRRRAIGGSDFGRPLGRPDVDPRVQGAMPNRPPGAEDLLLNWEAPFERPRQAAPVPLPSPSTGSEDGPSNLPLPVPSPHIPPLLPPPVLPSPQPETTDQTELYELPQLEGPPDPDPEPPIRTDLPVSTPASS